LIGSQSALRPRWITLYPYLTKKGRLIANGYPHEFNRFQLRRLTAFVVNRCCTDLPVSSQFLYDSQICAGVKKIGHEASPEVMA